MASSIVFHLPGRFLENYATCPHLQLQAYIHGLVTKRGGTIEVRRHDERCHDPKETDWSDLFEPDKLHLVENGMVQCAGVLNTALAYLPPFYHLDAEGALANGSAASTSNGMANVDPEKTHLFWQNLQSRFVATRISRYSHPKQFERIPEGCIAIFLQGDNSQRWGTAHCDTEAMIRAVAKNSNGRPVVVKAHPVSNGENDRKLILKLLSEGLDLFLTEANIHDILSKCEVTVSFNSAVAIEGFFYNKPAILFGRSDFHHCCETVSDPKNFSEALSRALTSSWNYPAYLYWYFTTFCFSLNDPEVDNAIMKRFNDVGFSAHRLGMAQPSTWEQKLIKRENAEDYILAFLADRTEVQQVRGLEPIKVTDKSWVFSAEINGEKVVVKRFVGGDVSHTVRSLKSELDYIKNVFGDGKCQANKCLMAWPDDGIVVLSFVPGPRLGDKISTLKGQQRRNLLSHSGEWLSKYTNTRRRSATFGPRFWIKKLLSKDLSHINDVHDVALLRELVDALRIQKEKIRGCPVIQAATHGDFVGINAHFQKGVIYGVDIQGESWLPIAKEAARFLVWLQIHDVERPQKRHAGISLVDWEAFLDSGVLPESEVKTTLPFFVGEQLYGRYVESYDRKEIRQNTRAAIESYLTDYTL